MGLLPSIPGERGALSQKGFYACPGFGQNADTTCGGILKYYCKSWSCITSNDGNSKWKVNPHYVDMTFASPCPKRKLAGQYFGTGPCNLIRIKFLEDGKKDTRWTTGLNWGIYLYRGPPYYATVIQIKLKAEPKTLPTLVGPNQLVGPPNKTDLTQRPTDKSANPPNSPTTQAVPIVRTTSKKENPFPQPLR
uniref:Envelope glycoprotein n=1 Tax=Felis catus TaxID=9685 RepID=A0ABI8AD41_FELCA